jgi:hypothetical protein
MNYLSELKSTTRDDTLCTTVEMGGVMNGADMEIFSGYLASQSLHQKWQKTYSKQQAVQSKTFAYSLINVYYTLPMLVTNIQKGVRN